MGVKIYWLIVAAVILFGIIMPQSGWKKKYYIIFMTGIHIFVCGFRYMYLTGDLMKYEATYKELLNYGWRSDFAWQDGRNTGFQWLMKFFAQVSDGDFQVFLFALAVVTQVIFAVLVYKYSPRPWMSYLVWNCMAFYVTYDFTSIKQGLAMAVLMCAMICIFENRPKTYLLFILLAGFIHMPALCFLPAYWIMQAKVNRQTLLFYVFAALIIFAFRTRIVDFVTELYYEGNDEIDFIMTSNSPGGRFAVIALIALTGLLIKGFREKRFEQLFHIIIIAAIFQMFSSFNNVFTRLADYYLQFAVLFIPMIFYNDVSGEYVNVSGAKPVLAFNQRSIRFLIILLSVVLIWWYNFTCLGVKQKAVDDFTNYRFMWEVNG